LATVIQGAEFHDYASDVEVIRYCGMHATTFKTNALDKKTLKNLDLQVRATPNSIIAKRWERFNSISLDLITNQEEVLRHLGEFFISENGNSIIQSHVQNMKIAT